VLDKEDHAGYSDSVEWVTQTKETTMKTFKTTTETLACYAVESALYAAAALVAVASLGGLFLLARAMGL
jgi:hypothetical protein